MFLPPQSPLRVILQALSTTVTAAAAAAKATMVTAVLPWSPGTHDRVDGHGIDRSRIGRRQRIGGGRPGPVIALRRCLRSATRRREDLQAAVPGYLLGVWEIVAARPRTEHGI